MKYNSYDSHWMAGQACLPAGRPAMTKTIFKKDKFFKKIESLGLALSYGDVRLRTAYSEVAPGDVNLQSRFSRNVPLKVPLVSSPMDMVTEHKMAITLALSGGLGIIHRALAPKDQAKEVSRVKFYLNGLIEKSICLRADQIVKSVLNLAADKGYVFRSFPVLDGRGKLAGLISGSDLEFCAEAQVKVSQIMTKFKNLITAPSGISLKQSGLGYAGAADIKELQSKADFYYISSAVLSESHPHGVTLEKEAPNYFGRG